MYKTRGGAFGRSLFLSSVKLLCIEKLSNNEIYLWDFTDKSKTEFKETGLSDDLLNIAKEGAMLQYKNGRYELYSPYGYDMLFKENNNIKDEK